MRSNTPWEGADLARVPVLCQEKANPSRAPLSLNPETEGLAGGDSSGFSGDFYDTSARGFLMLRKLGGGLVDWRTVPIL